MEKINIIGAKKKYSTQEKRVALLESDVISDYCLISMRLDKKIIKFLFKKLKKMTRYKSLSNLH